MKNNIWIPIAILWVGLTSSAKFNSHLGLWSPQFIVLYLSVVLACTVSLSLAWLKAFPLSMEAVLLLSVGYLILLPVIKLSLSR